MHEGKRKSLVKDDLLGSIKLTDSTCSSARVFVQEACNHK